MKNNAYSAVKEWIENILPYVGSDDLIKNVLIEIAPPQNEDWQGIRLNTIPSSRLNRVFIDGKKEFNLSLQFLSKQSVLQSDSSKIDFSTFLDALADKMLEVFKSNKPAHPGLRFKDLQINSGSAMQFTDGAYAGYFLDVKFVYEV